MSRPSNPPDKADKARRKKLEYLESRIAPFIAAMHAGTRMNVRYLLWSSEFSEEELQRMLRAQSIYHDSSCPCRLKEGQAARAVMQDLIPGPLDPVPHPRNTLLCPLHERSLQGDEDVPCRPMAEHIGILLRGDVPIEQRAMAWATPCQDLTGLLLVHWPEILKMPPKRRPEKEMPGGRELRHQRDRLLQAGPAEGDPEKLRAQLRFLLDSGRLDEGTFLNLLADGMMVTDQEWLPCRDDPHRDLYKIDDSPEDPTPLVRLRCPLHVRAQLGDRTVPCAQALACAGGGPLIDEARLRQHYKVRPLTALRQSWDGEADQPGAPGDPVIALGIRPCYVLGRLLAHDLYPYLEFLATDRDALAADLKRLGEDESEIDEMLATMEDAEDEDEDEAEEEEEDALGAQA
jgi:hypothetical protein